MTNRAEDRVRGFPAFPPRTRGGSRPARTWWTRGWVRALEDTVLDGALLLRARRYANAGQVGSITVSPGRLDAAVHDGDPVQSYQARVLLEPFSDGEWDQLLELATGRAGYAAALLERELPRQLVTDADEAGVRLLPGVGDLLLECGCPYGALACVHAAALGYQAAWLLADDPILLMLLRGRGERELLDQLPGSGGPVLSGVPAEQVYAQPVAPLPAPLAWKPDPAPPADPVLARAAAHARRWLDGG